MASLVTPADVKVLVKTALTDPERQAIVDQEEAEVIRHFGAHYVDAAQEITETIPGGKKSLWLRRRVVSVSQIIEDTITLTSGEYRVWPDQGRVTRLNGVSAWLAGEDTNVPAKWGEVIQIKYKPADDNAQRKPVVVELVRTALERTSMASENFAGEYNYQAPSSWEARRGEILQRLSLGRV